jgi:hypothetical protein
MSNNGLHEVFKIEESCEEMSFSMLSGKGAIYLSCPTSKDILIHVHQPTGEKLVQDGFQFLLPSKRSSVEYLGDRLSVVAKSHQRNEGKTTILFQKYKSKTQKGSTELLKPEFENEVYESKVRINFK